MTFEWDNSKNELNKKSMMELVLNLLFVFFLIKSALKNTITNILQIKRTDGIQSRKLMTFFLLSIRSEMKISESYPPEKQIRRK